MLLFPICSWMLSEQQKSTIAEKYNYEIKKLRQELEENKSSYASLEDSFQAERAELIKQKVPLFFFSPPPFFHSPFFSLPFFFIFIILIATTEHGNGATACQDKSSICEERRNHTDPQGSSPNLGAQDKTTWNSIGQATQGTAWLIRLFFPPSPLSTTLIYFLYYINYLNM